MCPSVLCTILQAIVRLSHGMFLLTDVNLVPGVAAFALLMIMVAIGLGFILLVLIFRWRLLGMPVIVPSSKEES